MPLLAAALLSRQSIWVCFKDLSISMNACASTLHTFDHPQNEKTIHGEDKLLSQSAKAPLFYWLRKNHYSTCSILLYPSDLCVPNFAPISFPDRGRLCSALSRWLHVMISDLPVESTCLIVLFRSFVRLVFPHCYHYCRYRYFFRCRMNLRSRLLFLHVFRCHKSTLRNTSASRRRRLSDPDRP